MGQTSPQRLSEAEIIARLRQGEVTLPPLEIEWLQSGRSGGPDVVATIRWEAKQFRFGVEVKDRSTPRTVEAAIARARGYAAKAGVEPMIVVPYLAPASLEKLEQERVSGIDLCGNAMIVIPGQLLVRRSGNPNRFRESFPIRDVYRGTSSLVARALLVRPRADSLTDLDRSIRALGGSITLTTISKVLRRLEDDVLIERKGGRASVLQADALLDRLAAAYRSPKVTRTFIGATKLDRERLSDLLATSSTKWVLSGQSSTERYATMGREDTVRIYCTSIPAALAALGSEAKETDRFTNLELRETSDPTVYFDARTDGTQAFASPVQTYLELAAGDKRERDASAQVRGLILRELAEKGAA